MRPLPPHPIESAMASTAPQAGDPAPTGPDRLLAEAAQVARHADARLSAALSDLFLPDFVRPTDAQRAAMANMLTALLDELEADLRAGLADRLGEQAPPVLTVQRIPILRPIFDRAGVLRDRELVALLLTRAEEQRICRTLLRVSDVQPGPVAAAPSGISTELEQALLGAERRRYGPLGEPGLTTADLPAELLHRLSWWAAAALRDYLERSSPLDPGLRDEALSAAVQDRLARHDEGLSLEVAAMRAAMAGDRSDQRLVDTFRGGRFSLFVALLAVRARLDFAPAFLMAADPSISALAVLLRAIEASTQAAAPILLQMAAVNQISDMKLEERVGDFLDLDLKAAQDALRPWRLDRAFRGAIADIGRERRQK
jgi:hypothetical protein